MYFSMYMPGLPKAAPVFLTGLVEGLLDSSSFHTTTHTLATATGRGLQGTGVADAFGLFLASDVRDKPLGTRYHRHAGCDHGGLGSGLVAHGLVLARVAHR